MKLITWNVFSVNPKILQGLKYISNLNPDVVCLQEFPQKHIYRLESFFPGYSYKAIPDSVHKRKVHKNNYLVTLSRIKIKEHSIFNYGDIQKKSFLKNILYGKIQGQIEQNKALVVEVKISKTKYSVYNLRLSCATTPKVKLEHINKLVTSNKNSKTTLLSGDFNVVGNKYWKILLGWTKSYSIKDYLINELNEVKKLVMNNEFQIATSGFSTNIIPSKNMLFGGVVIPKNITPQTVRMHRKHFMSDHRILEVVI